MNDIPYIKLGELCTVNQGLQIPISKRYKSARQNRYFYITVQFLKDSHNDKYFVENPPVSSICKEDDIIVVRTGSTGKILTGIKGCFHNNFFKVNYDKEKVNGRFLYYCLNSKEKQKEMKNRSGITTIPDLNHFMFLDMKIPLPVYSVQVEIAKVIDSISSKIELNNKINAELETMAKLIYDYWFVQFDFPDPSTSSGQAGKPYKSSGGKMVYNKKLKREIPEGWEVKALVDEMSVQYGYPFSTAQFNEDKIGKPVIRIRDILNNSISLYSTESADEKYRLEKGDLLIGMDGNFHLNFWDKDDCYLNQRSVRIRKKEKSTVSHFQALFSIEPYIKAREKNVSRTTVGHLSAKDINGLNVLIPSSSKLIEKCNLFDSTLDKLIVNRNENQKLAELRDWLLPMLMNGQVTVGEIEEKISMAAEPGVNYKKSKV